MGGVAPAHFQLRQDGIQVVAVPVLVVLAVLEAAGREVPQPEYTVAVIACGGLVERVEQERALQVAVQGGGARLLDKVEVLQVRQVAALVNDDAGIVDGQQ